MAENVEFIQKGQENDSNVVRQKNILKKIVRRWVTSCIPFHKERKNYLA